MTNPVFLIPDVLSEILEQVDYSDREPHWLPVPRRPRGPRTLARCLLVNKLWFNEASRILWREGASLSCLARVETKARRQHYASMIKQLTVNNIYEAYGRYRFSKLDSLVILNSQHKSLEQALGLLVPTLKHVTIICPSIECIEKLERNCPLVESLHLHIDKLNSEEDVEKVKRYLNAVRAVVVELPGDYSDILFPSLARNECVRELTDVKINNTSILSSRGEGGMQTFKNLRILSSKIGCEVRVRDLLDVAPNLECVVLDRWCHHDPIHIDEHLNDVLQFASVGLKRICMAAGVTHVDKPLLLAMADKFRQLESVQIYSLRLDFDDQDMSEDLDDEFAHDFTSRLPNLRVIELEFHESLSAVGLISIGKNCPHLELLDLYGHIRTNQATWSKRVLFNYPRFCMEKEPLFPRLIFLAPAEKLKHLPRSMQEYHFPRIFAQWEHSSFVVSKGTLRTYWKMQRSHFR